MDGEKTVTRKQFVRTLASGVASAAPRKMLEDFRIAGDGKTDDSSAIQKAVDSGLGELRFWRGTFRLTKPVVVDLERAGPFSISGGGVARFIMAGAGPAFRIVGTHTAGTAAPHTFKPNVWERQRAPMLDGFEIVGEHAEALGVQVEGAMQPTITRLLIRRARHGIVLTGRNRNVTISDCHVYENGGAGVLLEKLNLHQVNIHGCHISYNAGGGIVIRGSEIRNIQIGTCDIEANQHPKGPPAANVLFDAREGSILEGAITGCTVQHAHENPGSANIRFLGRGPADRNKAGNFTIANNVLSDVAVNIHLQHARGVVIQGNTFWKGYEHHLLVEGSSDIVVGSNIIDRNPDYKAGDSRDDIVFTDSFDSTIQGLHMNRAGHPGPGLVLRRCRRFELANVRILDAGGRALQLESSEEIEIHGGNLRDER